MPKRKSDVVFARVGRERRARLRRAERITGLGLAEIVRNALDKELRALRRRFPELNEEQATTKTAP